MSRIDSARMGPCGAVAVWSAGSLSNTGDWLLPLIFESQLKKRLPGVDVRHFCPLSRGAKPAPLWMSRNGLWPGSKQFAAILVPGGGVLAGPPFRHPLMQVYCLGHHPRLFEPEVFVGWHAIGLQDGTPRPDKTQWLNYFREVIERLDYVSVRSSQTLQRIRLVTANASIVPDPIFVLSPKFSDRPGRGRPALGAVIGTPFITPRLLEAVSSPVLAERFALDERVTLSAEEVAERQDLREFGRAGFTLLAALVSVFKALSTTMDVNILGIDNMYGDAEFSRAVASAVPGSQLLELPARSYRQLQEFAAANDVVMVSRLHVAILVMGVGRPFIAVEPNPSLTTSSKLAEFMWSAGLPERYWRIERDSMSDEALALMVEAALHSDPERIRALYIRDHRNAQQSFDVLAHLLSERIRR